MCDDLTQDFNRQNNLKLRLWIIIKNLMVYNIFFFLNKIIELNWIVCFGKYLMIDDDIFTLWIL